MDVTRKKRCKIIEQVMICCRNIQGMIDTFGDNPTIFAQTNEYICAVIGQCMVLRDLIRYSLSYRWRQSYYAGNWCRVLAMCNRCAHPRREKLNVYYLWFFIKADIPALLAICQEYLELEEWNK